jgi:hypothetical protein
MTTDLLTLLEGKKDPNIEKRLIKKLGTISVYSVNGFKVRNLKKSDEEFTNCAQHYQLPRLIPKNEFWIDEHTRKDEQHFYIDGMLSMIKSLAQSVPHLKAVKISDRKERDERKSASGEMMSIKSGDFKIEKRLWKNLKDGTKVYIVNGKQVRDVYKVDYTEGGHGYVYGFVPKDEIWIDDDVVSAERPFIFLHEQLERDKMKNEGWKYNRAHAFAAEKEWEDRQDKETA